MPFPCREIGFVLLRWATEPQEDRALVIDTTLLENKLETANYYGSALFNSIIIRLRVLQSNIVIYQFTHDLFGHCIDSL